MTGHTFPASCMECGREDVPSFLCAECRASVAYKTILFVPDESAFSDALTYGIGIIGPDGKHIAIQDFFDTTEVLP